MRHDWLDAPGVDADPYAAMRAWIDEAARCEAIVEPYAMALATVSSAGRPSARIVLLRGFDARGLRFFTNYDSAKGAQLAEVPYGAIVLYWGPLARQIRAEGYVERIPPEESDAYFMQRPRGHRLSAWASAQSTVVPDRAFLETKMAEATERFEGRDVGRPPYWGGYRLIAERIELWQGRPDRLHDRILYVRTGSGWRTRRLSP
jgi:pyridoxamine 5'-phosphate oxidase